MVIGSDFFWSNQLHFQKTDDTTSFSISTPALWPPTTCVETVKTVDKLLKFRYQNDIELHIGEIMESGSQIKI